MDERRKKRAKIATYRTITGKFTAGYHFTLKLHFIDKRSQLPQFSLAVIDRNVPLFNLPGSLHILGGELCKSLRQVETIYDFLLQQQVSSDHTITAIGGGTTLDMVGFAAATYKRGINWQVVPTTLLAMVDAAIGGKTAVNYQGIKNCVGAFHPPTNCFICFEFLQLLPRRQLLEGLIEMIKHAILDAQSNDDQSHLELIHKLVVEWDFTILQEAIRRSIAFKLSTIEKGEEERHMLNFGHTFGHALESFYAVSHASAVLLGMLIESFYVGGYSQVLSFYQQLPELHFEVDVNDFEHILEKMRQDKKNYNGNIYLAHPTKKRVPITVRDLKEMWGEVLCQFS